LILFYSTGIYLLIDFFVLNRASYKGVIKTLMPITTKYYWFASSYFIMYILFPYINVLFRNISMEEFKRLILVTTIIWCVIPSIMTKDLECNNLLWFIYLYGIAVFIKLKYESINCFKMKYLYASLFLAMLFFGGLFYLFNKINIDYKMFFGIQRIPTLVVSLLLFIIALKTKVNNNLLINNISKCTFGIYLIHDHVSMRELLWIKILHTNSFAEKWYFIFYAIGIVMCVFLLCTIIEMIRTKISKKICRKIRLID